jgi:hypothetical protein
MYFGDFFDGFDSFHSDLDLLEVLSGKAELTLEQERGCVLKTISQHNKLNMIYS